jgi:hypothetical protein
MLGSGALDQSFLPPPCLSTGYEFELTARDIMPGEELTDDYGSLNLTEALECHCGHAECRRIIQPDDSLRYANAWDTTLAQVFPLVGTVAQPLWPLVKAPQEVELVLQGELPLPSCRAQCHVWQPAQSWRA